MLYEYKCPECDNRGLSKVRANRLPGECPCGFRGEFKRVFSFSTPGVMQEHWNDAVGGPVSSMRAFKEELKIKSEQATMETGIEHNFQPLEYGDHAAFGATGEGIDESNRVRSKLGMPLLPDIG